MTERRSAFSPLRTAVEPRAVPLYDATFVGPVFAVADHETRGPGADNDMAEFQTVAQVGDIPDGEGRAYEVGGRIVAVFRQGDGYTAIDDICPHAGASLSGGHVENGAVMCPWHAWQFCIREGTWLDNPKSRIKQQCFEVRVEGTDIQVKPAE